MALSDSLQLRTARWGVGVTIQQREVPDITLKFGTENLPSLGVTGYAPTLLKVQTIRRDLDARATTSVKVTVRNGPTTVGPTFDVPYMLAAYTTLSCPAVVYLYFLAADGTLETLTLFSGVVSDWQLRPNGVDFTCDEHSKEYSKQLPLRQVLPDAMDYGTREGEEPKGQRGVAVPLFYGYFNPLGVADSWDTYGDADYTSYNYIYTDRWAPMVGVKCPMVPLAFLADMHQWENDGSTPKTDSKRLLFALGDKTTANNSEVLLHAELGTSNNSYTPTEMRPMPPPSWYTNGILWSGLYTWNQELDRAVQYLMDDSSYLSGAAYGTEDDAHTGGPSSTTQVGSGWYYNTDHTNDTADNTKVQTAWVQRTEPLWPKSGQSAPGYFTGRIAAVALLPEALDGIAGTTDSVTFGTSSGVSNPENALDYKNPATYATVPNGEQIALTMPATGPRLGDVLCLRVVVVRSGAATRVDAVYRFLPETGGVHTAPVAEFNCAAVGGSAYIIRGNNLSGSVPDWFTFYVMDHQESPYDTEQWVFTKLGTTPPQAYAANIVLENGYDSETFYLHAVWLEVIYRDPVTGLPEKLEGTDSGSYRRGEDAGSWLEDPVSIRPIWRFGWGPSASRPPQVRVAYRYSGNVPDPSAQPLGAQKLYATGLGPKHYSASPGTNTSDRWKPGRTGAADYGYPIHNPASIALHIIDKYLGEYSSCEVGDNAHGSFRDAMEYLETAGGGTWPAYRLSVVVDQRASVRAILNKLGDHSRSIVCKQRGVDGTVKWRMFVDSYNPATDFPANRWRSGEEIRVQDTYKASVASTPLDAVRNRFVLRYGWHSPTGKYALERILNKNDTDLATDATTYKTACSNSEGYYGGADSSGGSMQSEEVLEFPWVWYDKVADDLLKYHCNLRRQLRLYVKLTCNQNLLDILPGQIVYLEDGFSTYLGQYSGRNSGSAWSGHQWHVVSKDVKLGRRGIQVELTLLERVVAPS